MQLVEVGKIELDAPVQRYLPWFTHADPQMAAQITVRHMLNQTSDLIKVTGWETPVNFDVNPDATEKHARELATFKPNRPVGSMFEYSNTNYNLLGLIIEAASGEKYADYVQINIFDSLGDDSYLHFEGCGHIKWHDYRLHILVGFSHSRA